MPGNSNTSQRVREAEPGTVHPVSPVEEGSGPFPEVEIWVPQVSF